jgi:acyl carrier protein
VAGHSADLEIVHRTLRVRDAGAPAKVEPVVRAAAQAALTPAAVPAPIRAATERERLQTDAPPVPAPAPKIPVPDRVDPVQERILALVVEKTGYPLEMLDLDLDMEADLGVDTVKQAEMFAAIRETYNIPRDPNLKLRDFPTLARVIQFVYDRRPDLTAVAPAPAKPPAPPRTLACLQW